MKSNIFFLLILNIFFASCTVNVNQPNANMSNLSKPSPSPTDGMITDQPAHWSVVVCSSRAKSVTLSAGSSEGEGEVFGTWKQDAIQRQFYLPTKLQNLSKIYFKASASDRNQVEMCVLYNGKAKKRVEFDDDEDTFIASSDTDEIDNCRCTQ